MAYNYAIYGLRLHSNRSLSGLASGQIERPVDIRFEETERPVIDLSARAVRDSHLISDGSFSAIRRSWALPEKEGDPLRLFYRSPTPGAADFLIHGDGHSVECHRSPPATLQDVTTLLLGTVLNAILRLRGTLCLHACVVNIGSRAVAFLGDRGAGKSTTAAAFAHAGYPILSDDIAATTKQDDDWVVQPGYPRIRLWGSTMDAFEVSREGRVPVLTPMDKYFLDLSAAESAQSWRFQPTLLPLHAIYLLTRDAELDQPLIEPLQGIERLTTLVTHTNSHFAPLSPEDRTREFSMLSQLATRLPVRQVRYPSGLQRLPELRDAIVKDVERIGD